MKNKTQENEKKTIIPKQKKQRSVKKEKSAVTKKTAKKTRNSSMAVKLVAILVLMVAVTMVSNVINYEAMVKMNHSIKDVTDSKVPDLQNAYNIQYSLEAVQKDFYRYLATTKGETSHTEARNDYAADREAVADLVQQMYDATEGDGQKQIMQKIYDGVNNVLERMDNAMEKYDDGKSGKVSIEVNVIRVCMEEVNAYITGIQQKSVNEMDEATAQAHATYQAVSKVCVGMAVASILVGVAGILVILIGVVKPMRAATRDLMKMITEIDGGRGDLTAHLKVRGNDEIGQMVRGFNQFIDVLRNLIEKIKKVPENSNIQRRVLTTESAQRAIRSQVHLQRWNSWQPAWRKYPQPLLILLKILRASEKKSQLWQIRQERDLNVWTVSARRQRV